ncbi:ABC transporter ATP-binding protein [Leisingera sp.]|uniref:ABC transporter ATP-binding protein n=1 Tax=Leisingera sp. TaxID=1879318 RepID=UPI002B27B4B5|nr:ABC transporter ATP-binding protein [Leisingera sp.]
MASTKGADHDANTAQREDNIRTLLPWRRLQNRFGHHIPGGWHSAYQGVQNVHCGRSRAGQKAPGNYWPKAASGRIRVGGEDIARLSPRALAGRQALLAQDNEVPPGVTVADLVGYGRAPHQNLLGIGDAADRAHVACAITWTGLEDLAGRKLAALSGGQLQRAFIAMVLAQDMPAMLFDEPTSWLDIRRHVDVLRLMRSLARVGPASKRTVRSCQKICKQHEACHTG